MQYKNEALLQTNDYTYLGGVTVDNKLSWKTHIERTVSEATKRLSVMKRLAGSRWGCARLTLNTTYKIYVLPTIMYCCEPIITTSHQNLQKLEQIQNQALRLITGVKSTSVDAMLDITYNRQMQNLIQEKALLLHKKLARLRGDQYWKNYLHNIRNLKTQQEFIQKVRAVK